MDPSGQGLHRVTPQAMGLLLSLGVGGSLLWATPASAVDGAFCIVNRANRPFQIVRGSKFETVAPGRQACCQSNCRSPVAIGIDVSRDPDLKEILLKLGLKLASRGRSLVPGQPSGVCNWISICRANWRRGDKIEVYAPNGKWRCDVVDARGSLRETIAASGQQRPAQTALRVCNKAGDGSAYVAKALTDRNGRLTSKGWYEVAQGECDSLRLPPGYRGRLYVYAETRNLSWKGTRRVCVDPEQKFEIPDAGRGSCGWRYQHYLFLDRNVDGRGASITLTPQ